MSGTNAPRPGGVSGSRSVGSYGLVCEVTRGVLGTLWVARTEADRLPPGALVRRIVAEGKHAGAKASIAEAAEWGRRGNDPRLPTAVEITQSEGEVAIAFPFVDGEPLRALLRAAAFKREPLEASVATRVAVETLEMVHAVHERTKYDPMHRAFGGLVPDSVMLGTDGLVRLLDVGVAVACSEAKLFEDEAQWVAYMAPEQLRGEEATAATDVFVVGAMLWEMLANRRLFAGATADAVRGRVLDGPIQRLDQLRGLGAKPVEGPVVDVVAKALERDPAARYATAAEMSDALRGALAPADASAVATTVKRLASQFLDKRRAVYEKAGLSPEPLDGRTTFVERAGPSKPGGASEQAPPSGGLSALTKAGTAGQGASSRVPPPPPSRTPPPPPSRTPPPPPSVRSSLPPAASQPAPSSPSSRADRALALAKAAAVAAPAPSRPPAAASSTGAAPSAPPAAETPPPAPAAETPPPAPAAETPPPAPAEAPPPPGIAASGSIEQTGSVAPEGGSAPGQEASPSPGASVAPEAPAPPAGGTAVQGAVAAPPEGRGAVSGPSSGPEPRLVASGPAPAAAQAAPSAAPPVAAPAGTVADLEATTGSGIAAGIALDDDEIPPFSKPSGSRRAVFVAAAAAALVVVAVVAFSGGGDEASEPAAQQAARGEAELPTPTPPEPAPAASVESPTAEEEDEAPRGAPSDDSEAAAAREDEPAAEEAEPEPAAEEAEPEASPKPAPASRPRVVPAPRKNSYKPPAPKEPAEDVGASFKPGGI